VTSRDGVAPGSIVEAPASNVQDAPNHGLPVNSSSTVAASALTAL